LQLGTETFRAGGQVPAEALRDELGGHERELQRELEDAVNRNFSDVLRVGSGLGEVEPLIDRVGEPLSGLAAEVETVRRAVAAELQAVLAGVERRDVAVREREQLELLQDALNAVAKLERLLGGEAGRAGGAEGERGAPGREGGAADAGLEERSKVLERIAAEASRLKFFVGKGGGLPGMERIQSRVAEVEARLARSLNKCFGRAVVGRDARAAGRCLGAYVVAGLQAHAGKLARQELIGPLVAQSVARRPEDEGPAPSLKPVLADVEGRMRAELGFLAELVGGLEPSRREQFDLAVDALAATDEAIAAALPGAYSPGVPQAFRANYVAALAFADFVQGFLCASPAAAARFRESAPHSTYLRRWNTSVYFSLHFQEIAGALETALGAGETGAGGGWLLQPSEALEACIEKVVSPDVFLPALADKLFRLCLQLLSRYTAWMQDGGGPLSAGAEGSLAAHSDAGRLAHFLRGRYLEVWTLTLSATGPAEEEGAAHHLRAALEEAAAQLEALQRDFLRRVAAELSEKCKEGLKFMRGIIATYRMTNRPMPSQPSQYVPGVLGPLRAFLEGREAQLDAAARTALVQATADAVSDRFNEVATDLLQTVAQTDASLKKLKKQPGASGAGASDADKMRAQLFLDVEEFGRELVAVGAQVQGPGNAFQRLLESVHPPPLLAGGGEGGAAGGGGVEPAAGGGDEAAAPPTHGGARGGGSLASRKLLLIMLLLGRFVRGPGWWSRPAPLVGPLISGERSVPRRRARPRPGPFPLVTRW